MPTATMCRVEVIARGSPFEMGVAQGESLHEKIQLAPDTPHAHFILFRM